MAINTKMKKITDELLEAEILLAIRRALDKYKKLKVKQILRVLAKFNLRLLLK